MSEKNFIIDDETLFNGLIDNLKSWGNSHDTVEYVIKLNNRVKQENSILLSKNKTEIIDFCINHNFVHMLDIEGEIIKRVDHNYDYYDLVQYFDDFSRKNMFLLAKNTDLFKDDIFFKDKIYDVSRKNILYRQFYFCYVDDVEKVSHIKKLLLDNKSYENEFILLTKSLFINEKIDGLIDFTSPLKLGSNSSFLPINILEDYPWVSYGDNILGVFKLDNVKYFFENFYDDLVWRLHKIEQNNTPSMSDIDYKVFYKSKFDKVFSNYYKIEDYIKDENLEAIKQYMMQSYAQVYELSDEDLIYMDCRASKFIYSDLRESINNSSSNGFNSLFKRRKNLILKSINKIAIHLQKDEEKIKQAHRILVEYNTDDEEFLKIKQFVKMSACLNKNTNKEEKKLKI